MLTYSDSFLPELQSIASIAFALNLAYIGLPRFRYRQDIENHTREKLSSLGDVPDEIKETTKWYKVLARMADLKNGGTAVQRKDFPKETWAKTYLNLFEKHWDRWLVVIVCITLVAILSLGTAHSTGHYGTVFGFDFLWPFTGGWFHFWFFLILLLGAFPCLMVWLGSSMVKHGCEYADNSVDDMTKTMQAAVSKVDAPTG